MTLLQNSTHYIISDLFFGTIIVYRTLPLLSCSVLRSDRYLYDTTTPTLCGLFFGTTIVNSHDFDALLRENLEPM